MDATYGCPDPDAFARHAVRGLLRLVPADRCSWNEIHPRKGSTRLIVEPGPADTIPEALKRHANDNPVVQHYRRIRDGRATRWSDLISRIDLHRLTLYNEYYRSLGVEHQIALRLPSTPGLVLGFALSRSAPDFSDRDLLVLDLLRPHLVRAREQVAATGALRARLDLLGRAVETADLGVILLSRDGRIAFATTRAQHWLREYLGPAGRRVYRLPPAVAEWLGRQEDATAPDGLPALREPLRVAREGRELHVRLAQSQEERVLLLEERRAGPEPAALASLGLTQRESEVLAWVAQGKSNDEVAPLLDARPRTVAKHLERIYRKLGVESRAAAVSRALAVARVSRPSVE